MRMAIWNADKLVSQYQRGLYNREYLAALRVLRSCREIRQPGSINNKINLNLIFASRLSYLAATTPGIFDLFLQPGYTNAAIKK